VNHGLTLDELAGTALPSREQVPRLLRAELARLNEVLLLLEGGELDDRQASQALTTAHVRFKRMAHPFGELALKMMAELDRFSAANRPEGGTRTDVEDSAQLLEDSARRAGTSDELGPCPRCGKARLEVQLNTDGTAWEADRCPACGGTWWHEPPKSVPDMLEVEK
jgi:Transcription factor zinc-finger